MLFLYTTGPRCPWGTKQHGMHRGHPWASQGPSGGARKFRSNDGIPLGHGGGGGAIMKLGISLNYRTWAEMGITDAASFGRFAAQLEAGLRQSRVVAELPPPPEAPPAAFLTWVQVAIHTCEYFQAVNKLGKKLVHRAACSPPSADMVSALVAKSKELLNTANLTVGMPSIVIMLAHWEEKGRAKGCKCRTLLPRLAAVRLAEYGLSPKACWWLNGNIVGIWQGVRHVRERVAKSKLAMVEVWRRLAVHALPLLPRSAALAATSGSAVASSSDTPTVAVGALANTPAVAASASSPSSGGVPTVAVGALANTPAVAASASAPASERGQREAVGETDKDAGNKRAWSREAWRREVVVCAVCGRSYRRSNRARHVDSEAHRAAKQARRQRPGE